MHREPQSNAEEIFIKTQRISARPLRNSVFLNKTRGHYEF